MNVFFISNAPTQCEIPVQDLIEKGYEIHLIEDDSDNKGIITKDKYQFYYIGSNNDLASIIEKDSADFYRFLKQFRIRPDIQRVIAADRPDQIPDPVLQFIVPLFRILVSRFLIRHL